MSGFGANTPMRTWSGRIYPIQELEPGMSLIHSSDGSIWDDYAIPTVVKKVYKSKSVVFRFHFWSGKFIDFTTDHLLCLTDNQNTHIEMTVLDYVNNSEENLKRYAFYRTYKYWNRNLIEYITNVEYLGVEERYYGIELDGEQTFYSEDYMILHC